MFKIIVYVFVILGLLCSTAAAQYVPVPGSMEDKIDGMEQKIDELYQSHLDRQLKQLMEQSKKESEARAEKARRENEELDRKWAPPQKSFLHRAWAWSFDSAPVPNPTPLQPGPPLSPEEAIKIQEEITKGLEGIGRKYGIKP